MDESNQEPTSLPSRADDPPTIDREAFIERFRQAFEHENNASIARKLQTTDATIKGYTDGRTLPIGDMLLRISRASGVNLHWLLTGKGPRRVPRDDSMFTEDEEAELLELAREAGRSLDEEIRILALAGARFVKASR